MLSLSLSSSLPFQSFAFPILSLTHDLFLSLSHTRYIYLSLSFTLPGALSRFYFCQASSLPTTSTSLSTSSSSSFFGSCLRVIASVTCHRINCLNLIKKYESEPFIAETFLSNHNKQVIICVCGQFPSTL